MRPVAIRSPFLWGREDVGTFLAPTRKVPKRMGIRGPPPCLSPCPLKCKLLLTGAPKPCRISALPDRRSRLTRHLKHLGCSRKGRLAGRCLAAWHCGAVRTPPPTDQDKARHGSTSPGGSCCPGERAAYSRPYGRKRNPAGLTGLGSFCGLAYGRVWDPPLRTGTKLGRACCSVPGSHFPPCHCEGRFAARGNPRPPDGGRLIAAPTVWSELPAQIGTHPAPPLRRGRCPHRPAGHHPAFPFA